MENFNAKNNLTETENTITLTGFVGTTPEYRNLGKDFKLSQFILGIKSKESEKQKTYWHTILAYGRYADVINQDFKKGNRIWLKGRVIERSYTNKNGELKQVREISLLAVKKLENTIKN